jgi:hypothetical protein
MSYIQPVIDWIISCILLLPQLVFWAANELLKVVISSLPELSIVDPATLMAGFSGDLIFWLTLMKFGYGLAAISSALMARFVLRRIPFIGG